MMNASSTRELTGDGYWILGQLALYLKMVMIWGSGKKLPVALGLVLSVQLPGNSCTGQLDALVLI
jgi:hypothetical protein